MTDEKDIMVLLQHIIWNLCSLTDERKFACNENLLKILSQADGGYVSEGEHRTDKWFSYFTGTYLR